jgi:patatin-related protein
MSTSSSPKAEYAKEVRFAVVMYGGVSLAIYINGVSQELFRMVRSTAPAGPGLKDRPALSGSPTAPVDGSLNGTERVYRKLSHLLSDEALLIKCRDLANKAKNDAESSDALRVELEDVIADDNREIKTGFIVDILSGTSAGGINSIYLAKALANEQRIDRLKQLWINEGDLGLLLNDPGSLKGIELEAQDPPQSLLNSRRMYFKLLRALDDMERDKPSIAGTESPYAKELDLYITATDIEGVPVPLKLADKIVYERRHRNVFHFEWQESEQINDFLADSNPFLAFAARCTSSFPFAFEPMRLSDIDEVLAILPDYTDKAHCKSDSEKWKRYFKEILDPRTGVPNLRYARRSFGDGGYLDNKPFSYAIEALVRRQSDVPVDRRLIYIEPSPEHPEDVPERDYKPDALANVKSALLDLPSYETIREDLQKVLQRNLLIERVQRIISDIEKDANNVLPDQLKERLKQFEGENGDRVPEVKDKIPMYAQRNLTSMVKEKGRSFLSYRKLRISSVTDDIARLIARLLNFDAKSDLFLPLRCLVRAWRAENYFDNKKPTLNQFLTDYDLSHRIRRLNLIREKLDRLYDYNGKLQTELSEFEGKYGELSKLLQPLSEMERQEFRDKNADIGWLLGLLRSSSVLSGLDTGQKQELRDVVIFIKSEVNKVYKDLQKKARLLRQRSSQQKQDGDAASTNPILESFQDIGITAEHLVEILEIANKQRLAIDDQTNTGTPNEDECYLAAQEFLRKHSGDKDVTGKLKAAAGALKDSLQESVTQARETIGLLLDPGEPISADSERGKRYLRARRAYATPLDWLQSPTVKAVREYLAYYYYNFEEYDQISFPIFYEADVGEASVVEVIRVSPEDATSLIDERKERRNSPDGTGRQKLAGVALHHFGAFLDRTWRQNDIMWGRLDGFERLITALLPGPQNENLRQVLIEEGHTSILIDELPPESRLQLGGLVSEALVRASAGEPMEKAVAKVTRHLKQDTPVRTKLEAVIRGSLDNKELLEFIKTGYEVNRKLDPRPLLTSISRSTQIIGKVFENVANANQLDGRSLAWIARLGQLFWGLVEVAVPNTIKNMLWNHWLSVIYAFEFFTIVAGLLLSSSGAQQFGWTAFGITVVLNVLVLVLKDIMRGRRAVFRATGLLVCLVILGLSILGLLEILGPVFGVRWGEPEPGLYPMSWLKETIRPWIPMAGWLGRSFMALFVLLLAAIVLVLLNGVFGLVDFSWLDQRWQLFKKWLKRSKLRSYFPWGLFKPIRLLAEDIEKKTRLLPGKQDLYLLPFSLSGTPTTGWIRFFESSFKRQQNGQAPTQQAAVNNREVVVVSSATDLDSVFPRVSNAVASANKQYQDEVNRRATEDYENQKLLIALSGRRPAPIVSTLTEELQTHLKELRLTASERMGRLGASGVRLLGALTIVMSITILVTLFSNYRLMSRHPDVSLPGGLHAPGIAMELVRNPQEVDQIIRTQGLLIGEQASNPSIAGKNQLRKNIAVDWVVIVYYALALGLICFWLHLQRRGSERRLALFAGLSVLAAAGFDILENIKILEVLNESPASSRTVDWILTAATIKWALLFIALGLLGWLLWSRKQKLLSWMGALLLLPMIVGGIGLIGLRIALEWGFWLMALALLPVGLLLLVRPRTLERSDEIRLPITEDSVL